MSEREYQAAPEDEAVNVVLGALCKMLGVRAEEVNWDAATETWDGDVSAVLGNILIAAFGDDADLSKVGVESRRWRWFATDARVELLARNGTPALCRVVPRETLRLAETHPNEVDLSANAIADRALVERADR